MAREPKLFSYFPESKTKLVRYCNNLLATGTLSTDAVQSELINNIVPKSYKKLIEDVGEENKTNMPKYEELLQQLELNTISLSAVWLWLIYLGYTCSENKCCYYTDEHESKDVVEDRDNLFLIAYLSAESQTHRWV